MDIRLDRPMLPLRLPARLVGAIVAGVAPTELTAEVLALAAPALSVPWLCALLPGAGPAAPRLVVGPDVPVAVAERLDRDLPSRFAALPRTRPARLASPPPGLAAAGVAAEIVYAPSPSAACGRIALWLGAPSGPTVPAITADDLDRLGEVGLLLGAIVRGDARRRRLGWARSLVRPGGVLDHLALDASSAAPLEALCRAFGEIAPVVWAVVPWVGERQRMIHAPALDATLSDRLRSVVRDADEARSGGVGAAVVRRRLRRVLLEAADGDALAHNVHDRRGQLVATVLAFAAGAARPVDRRLLRVAGRLVAVTLEHERLRADRAATLGRMHRLLQATTQVVWSLDATLTLGQAWGWQELTGHEGPEPLESWLAAIHPDDRAPLRMALDALRLRRPGPPVRTLECRVGGRDGRYHHLAFRLLVEPGETAGPAPILAGASDVTHEREAERALEGLVEERERYASTLAHELRTPLATMSAALAVLRPAVAQEPVAQEALAVLGQSLESQTRLVARVIMEARSGRTEIGLSPRPFDLGALLRDLAPPLTLQARQKGLAFSLHLPAGVAVWITADRDRVIQMVNNLVTNAVRYTPAGGTVRLSLEREGGRDGVSIVVADDGPGIAPEDLPHIFDAYYRGEGERTGAVGLGLGLHLVRQLARAHGGDVAVASEGRGRGATFRLHLPRAGAGASQRLLGDAATAEEAGTVAPASAGDRPTILVVEDDSGLREMLVALLARSGYAVRTAASAAEALARAANGPPPGAMILDIGLPDLSGLDLLPRLHALPLMNHVPALALTGWGDDADVERTRAAGFVLHLVKPADLAVVTSWLGSVTGVAARGQRDSQRA